MSAFEQFTTLGLSRREAEVLTLAERGLTSKQIGFVLSVSSRTVDKHLQHVYERFGCHSRTAALAYARRPN